MLMTIPPELICSSMLKKFTLKPKLFSTLHADICRSNGLRKVLRRWLSHCSFEVHPIPIYHPSTSHPPTATHPKPIYHPFTTHLSPIHHPSALFTVTQEPDSTSRSIARDDRGCRCICKSIVCKCRKTLLHVLRVVAQEIGGCFCVQFEVLECFPRRYSDCYASGSGLFLCLV